MSTTRKAQRARIADRRAKAIQLRLAGLDWQAIADRVGYGSRGAACQDVRRAMEQHLDQEAEAVALMRQTETQRLDRLQAALWPAAIKGDVKAAEAALKIIERRVKLHGLDAPRRVSVEADRLSEEIGDLLGDLASGGDES